MRTVLADKIFYFKKVKYEGCFPNKSSDFLIPWSKVNNISFCSDSKLTVFNFNQRIIKTEGDVISQVVDVLNRPYTNGVILEENGTVKELF